MAPRNMNKSIIVLLIFAAYSMQQASAGPPVQFQAVSLVAILAAPAKWSETEIVTSGFLLHTNRGSFLFLGEQDAENYLFENSVAVVGYNSLKSEIKTLSNKYVTVKGTFKTYDSESVIQAPLKGCILLTEVSRTNAGN
jgi:hypothetical protein